MQVGLDVSVPDLQRQKVKRVKRGECPECGNKLFKTATTGIWLGRMKKATAINEAGKCLNGRCLVCFPLNQTEEEEVANKKLPIPRIILAYQTKGLLGPQGVVTEDGTIHENTNLTGASVVPSCGVFGLDFDDDVSEITLDRRIRHDDMVAAHNMMSMMMGAEEIDSSHNSYANKDLFRSQNAFADSDSKMISLSDESEKSLRARMNEFLQEEDAQVLTTMMSSVPDEEHDEQLVVTDDDNDGDDDVDDERMIQMMLADSTASRRSSSNNKWDAPPEQAPPRKFKKAAAAPDDSAQDGGGGPRGNKSATPEGKKNDRRRVLQGLKGKSMEIFVEQQLYDQQQAKPDKPRRNSEVVLPQQQQQQRPLFPGVRGSSSKKMFHPLTMFVPPSTTTTTTEEGLQNPEQNIILEAPELLLGSSNSKKTTTDQGGGSVEDDDDDALPMHSAENNRPTAEIFFDYAAIPPSAIDKGAAVKLEASEQATVPAAVPASVPASASVPAAVPAAAKVTEEVSGYSEQESLMGFATENSSHRDQDADEYGAYSSKLLMMLNRADSKKEKVVAAKRPSTRLQDIQPSGVLPHSPEQDAHSENGSKEVMKEPQHKMVDTLPSTADSSRCDDGTSRHGMETPEQLVEPAMTPKPGEPDLLQEPTSPRKKPPPGPKPAPNSPGKVLVSPKKPPPPPLTETKMEPVSDLNQHLQDIPMLLRQLKNGRTEDHQSALLRLTVCLWVQGPSAKLQFAANDGIKVLAATMWADMMVPSAERAAAELFLALVTASSPAVAAAPSSLAATDALLGSEDTERLVDALLITMQTLIMDDELQQVGCRILCCLASSSNSNDNDGTRSGACLAVLNAMDAHYTSAFVQEWGLRALYNQCVYSKHAETNKRTLLSSKLDTSGATGGDVLERIILSGAHHLRDGGVLEWACRLCWCLTASNASVAKMVALRMDTLRELLHILEKCRSSEDASPQLQEAVLGTIANLSRFNQYKSFLGTSDVILLILDIMHGNKEYVEVQIEACCVIANIAGFLSPLEKEEIVDAGAVRTIVGAMFAFPREKHVLQEPALRALVGLALESEIAKEEICELETLSVVMHLCRLDDSSTLAQQEILCTLLGSLYASDRSMMQALQCDSLGALTSAVAAYRNSEKIQDAACFAFRNLSKNMDNLDTLLRSNAIGFAVGAMFAFKFSKTIQSNACCVLWNIGVGTEFGHQMIAETKAMKCIVNAIQTHMEVEEVIEVACGTLFGLIHRSPILRQQFFDNNSGVESVTCTLVMHSRSTVLLEKACGVLAFSSTNSRPFAGAVVADGVYNIVETMRNNPNSINILQHGAHFLRNTIMRSQSYVGEATGVVSVLINALKDFTLSDTFLSEACYFIWTIAELSYEARSRIIAMDGVSILLAILDQNVGNKFVEDAAYGAFTELTHESNTRR